MIDTPSAWDQFMAGSGFIDVLASLHVHPFVPAIPNVEVRGLKPLFASEEALHQFLLDVQEGEGPVPVLKKAPAPQGSQRKARFIAAATELLEWWEEYRTGAIPNGTYHLRTWLKRANAKRSGGGVNGLLTVADIDGSKLPTPTLEEVYEICWGYLEGQKELDRYNLLVQEKKERMLRGELGDGAGDDAGIDGWKKYVTKTIQP